MTVCGEKPRQATDAPFPYGHPGGRICYMELEPSGGIRQLRTREQLRAAVERAISNTSELLAVWPGEYRSDLFVIDDPLLLARAINPREQP